MKKTYKLADSVLHRFVQILQEGLLYGVDVADIMRMVDLEEGDDGKLVLTEAYKEMIKRQHEEALKFAEEMQAKQKETPELS